MSVAAFDADVITRLEARGERSLVTAARDDLPRRDSMTSAHHMCWRVLTIGQSDVLLSVMSKEHMVTGRKLRILGYMSSGDSVPGRHQYWTSLWKKKKKLEKEIFIRGREAHVLFCT